MASDPKTAIVVGASSGIGAALVELLARRGWRVAAVARREADLSALAERCNRPGRRPRVLVYPHDVTRYHEIPALFQQITADLGGLDMIVYAAGVMPKVAFDEFNTEKDRQIVEVNVIGAMAWLNEAAARFERLRRGRIVGIGSVAGDRGRSGQPAYGAAKAALATYLESLHSRLARHGVGVTTVKPGFIDTAMTKDLPSKPLLMAAEDAAAAILSAAEKKRRVVYVRWQWRLVMLVIRSIPSFIFKYLKV